MANTNDPQKSQDVRPTQQMRCMHCGAPPGKCSCQNKVMVSGGQRPSQGGSPYSGK